jgi:translation initiation factor IF-2
MEKKKIENDRQPSAGKVQKLEVVLKCDSVGSVEAVTTALSQIVVPGIEISFLRSGIGTVNKSDILLAGTAGRLIIGFQVGMMPGLEKLLRDSGVEVRLHELIYRLTEDIKAIAEDMTPSTAEEQIVGTGAVIALFKGTRKGIIVGCEVREGFLAVGQRYRIISPMGPVYTGRIESMHIEERPVQKATRGQQVGIRIRDFNKARIGDLVESFRAAPKKARWEPKGGVVRITH